MVTRLTGILESIDGHTAVIRPGTLDLALEVLVPGYLGRELTVRVGQGVTFHTFMYLEGQGQGTSFVPRLIGFSSPVERRFFELFTTVKGIGNRKALRALDEKPGVIAAAITRKDAKALVELPEIGKRLAETIVAELFGKVDEFLLPGADLSPAPGSTIESSLAGSTSPIIRDAIEALCALGETRPDAERKIARAIERGGMGSLDSPERIVAAVYAGR